MRSTGSLGWLPKSKKNKEYHVVLFCLQGIEWTTFFEVVSVVRSLFLWKGMQHGQESVVKVKTCDKMLFRNGRSHPAVQASGIGSSQTLLPGHDV